MPRDTWAIANARATYGARRQWYQPQYQEQKKRMNMLQPRNKYKSICKECKCDIAVGAGFIKKINDKWFAFCSAHNPLRPKKYVPSPGEAFGAIYDD